MSAKRQARGILIVDSDTRFLEELKNDPKSHRVPCYVASSLKEAQLLIAKKEVGLIALFINPMLKGALEISLFRHAHAYRPATPIFLLCDGTPPLGKEELEALGVQRLVRKPLKYFEIIELADASRFDAAEALDFASPENVGDELTEGDAGFKAIRASDFLSGSKSFFDIYVRLGTGRYIKIVKANDAFDKERVESYLKRGVAHFYLRKAAQEAYLGYCDQLSKIIAKNDKVDVSLKVVHVLNFGEEVMDFFKEHGLSETNLQYATHFVNHLHEMVDKIQASRGTALSRFMKDIASLDHGSSTAFVAHLLVKPLGFSDPETLELLGFACMFHDIGLSEMSEAIRSEDETRMTAEEIMQFHTHPSMGAKMLGEVKGISASVVQAVHQHHERRTRRGFPNQLGSGSINGIAEIVGLCDEFVNLMRLAKTGSNINPAVELESRIFNGFSASVVDAFRVGVFGKK